VIVEVKRDVIEKEEKGGIEGIEKGKVGVVIL